MQLRSNVLSTSPIPASATRDVPRTDAREFWARVIFILLFPGAVFAQVLGTGKGFKAAEYFPAPQEGQIQSLLEAERVQPLANKRFLLTEMKLQTFGTNGGREMLIQAPQCLYDSEAKSASSPGSLRVSTTDGKFWIEGEGFFFAQAASSLTISNRVRTFIDSEVLKSAPEKSGPTNAAPAKASAIEIRSDKFDYSAQSGEGLYQQNVQVSGTNRMSLNSQKLAFKLPVKERQLQSIQAEKDVVVDYAEMHATGQEATYSADTGVVLMSGNPAWRSEQREGRGDRLTIDRTNKIFRADGNAWVRMPAQSLSLSSLLSQSNSVGSSAASSTNHFVEIASSYHEFRTNWAQFGQQVKVAEMWDGQVRGTMACEQLNVGYTGSNQLNNLVAQGGVLLKDATNSLSGGRAVFDATNGLLVMTERPAWSSGLRSGRGEVIRVNTRTNEMHVSGNAAMRLPASELARAADPRSGLPGGNAVKSGTNEWAEVFAAEYTIRPQGLHFRGGVYATHPQMNWACETLEVQLPATGGQVEGMVAETGVAFDLLDEKGKKVHGIGDKAVYTYKVSGTTTNDLLELTGNPAVLHTTSSTNHGKTIIYDREKNTVRTIGDYTISSGVKGIDTNSLMLPKTKLTK